MLQSPPRTEPLPCGLPHSEECERALLAAFNVAAIVDRPDAVDRLLDMLEPPEIFYLERHQIIFQAIKKIRGRGEPVDMRTLQGELEGTGVFEAVGGLAYLAGMDLDLPDLGRVDFYAQVVKERWARRELVLKASEITSAALDGNQAAALIGDLQARLTEIEAAQDLGGHFRPMSEIVLDLDPFTPREGGMLGLPTGLADLDRKTRGLQKGHLIVVAGRPSMGKTSLAVQMAQHQALNGSRVGFVSLEDIEERLAYKVLSQISNVPHQRMELGRLSTGQREQVVQAMRKASQAGLWINDRESQTVEQVCASARLQAARFGLDALYVDYANLLDAAAKFESRNRELGYITKALKALAKSLEIPVVLLSQLKRLVPEDREPRLSDLRDSGEIEQNVDVAIFVHRPEFFEETQHAGIAFLIVDKNKGGERGTVSAAFSGETTSFRDLDRHHQPEPRRQGGWG